MLIVVDAKGFAFRGLGTRVLANALQSIVFTVCWGFLKPKGAPDLEPSNMPPSGPTKVSTRQEFSTRRSSLRGALRLEQSSIS